MSRHTAKHDGTVIAWQPHERGGGSELRPQQADNLYVTKGQLQREWWIANDLDRDPHAGTLDDANLP
ncbi:hypothetical protein Pen02_82260 [Plantactinospora endophytica]|uniref:Uncharacterized protein n=1 Tax=Plantactinospora endophytica TaxID=673535 RepID=A0ABQ4EF38_9ACTN|nr:hypothetical protein Pen02_82260 [Plantactinospora endophytica]